MPKEQNTLYKGCAAQVKRIEADERSVIAAISTGTIDRDNEVMLPKGAQLERFKANPVVLWSHDSSAPPIGKAIWIQKGTKKITAKVEFAETERAEEVWQLFKGGFLNAFSVGFDPIEHRAPTPADIRKNPDWASVSRIFSKWELLEFSPVAVPANPEALATAVKQHDIELSPDLLEQFELEEGMDDIEIEQKELEDLEPSMKLEEVLPAAKLQEVFVMEEVVDVDPAEIWIEMVKKSKGVMF